MVVLDASVLKLYDIASQSEIFGLHVVADASGLKRSSAFIDFVEIITENCSVGNLRTWQEAVGDGHQSACASLASQSVHIWSVGVLQ